jgi:hypothetical protein
MGRRYFIITIFSVLIIICGSAGKKALFSFRETTDGVELTEKGQKVFFYQKVPKEAPGDASFNNYLHSVYNLKGEVITEEFPADHFHHRGIFWAWHQIYINETSLGDGWMMESFSQQQQREKRSCNIMSSVGPELPCSMDTPSESKYAEYSIPGTGTDNPG